MMYSAVPNQLIFADFMESTAPTKKEMFYQGHPIEATRNAAGNWCLQRNLSTDPASFLKADMQIGFVLPEL